MTLRVISDIHAGVERSAGTTADTRWKLHQHILTRFMALLPNNSDLLINGDLFDAHDVSLYDVLRVYNILKGWLGHGHKLWLSAGNHDLSKTSNVMSSFELLGELLKSPQVTVVKEPTAFQYGYIIPHLANQTLFDAAIEAVPECETLYLHCNYNNFFATQADQSLNLSKDQAEKCKARQIVIGHEHSYKCEGKVLIPGNQIASSVSDWLGCNHKYFVDGAVVETCATKADEYVELDWKELAPSDHMFIRVVGNATIAEASQVVSAIARFRASSKALVISNAVNIETGDSLGDFANNLEAVAAFDVWRALGEVMSTEEMDVLKGLE